MQASEITVKLNNEELKVYRINADVNGNPRYVVHFLDLGVYINDYGKIPGLTKYRAKWFGGGYVFHSYNVQDDLEYMKGKVREYYQTHAERALLYAERYGIIEYEVKDNKMIYYEAYPFKSTTYKCTVNLNTMNETRREINEKR